MRWVLAALAALCLVGACATDQSPVVPSPPTALLRAYRFSGRALSDAGAPLAHARVTFSFQPTAVSITLSQASVFTDSAGQYSIAFTARLGGLDANGDTTSAFAFARVTANGYEDDARYFLPSASPSPTDFLLYATQTVTAGDSVVVTLRSSDPVCLIDDSIPGPYNVHGQCRTVRVATPEAGLLMMSLTDVGSASQIFAVFALDTGDDEWVDNSVGGALSYPVVAGGTYAIKLKLPPNTSEQVAVLRSRLAPP